MDTSEVTVLVGGVALIALTLWYFFGERAQAEAKASASGVQETTITVKGGYQPDIVVVQRGIPVRLNFRREETSSCSEQVIFGDFGIVRDLPAHERVGVPEPRRDRLDMRLAQLHQVRQCVVAPVAVG